MKIVLLSGGSGKRLWPLSNNVRSKQFLKLLDNGNGEKQSMVQRVWEQIKSIGYENDAFIATSKLQLEILHSQLGCNIKTIVEPERKDTFPAISLAVSYLFSEVGVDPEEVVCILPVDPYVENRFFHTIRQLEKVLNNSDSEIALVGVKPTYPSGKYGYIIPSVSHSQEFIQKVNRFIEKPSEHDAEALIENGALWNCGVFAFKMKYLINLLKEKKMPISYPQMAENYGMFEKISFDYEVLERTEKLVVIPYDGFWKDIGTWNTLTEVMALNHVGKGVISDDSTNTHLVNEIDIPITILGLSNIVVAAGPDGILISDKSASPRLKDLITFDEKPMYEERRWGWYRILDYSIENDIQVLIKRVGILEGKNLSYHVHAMRNEVWTVIKGKGELIINEKLYIVQGGDVIDIPRGSRHAIKAISDLEFVEVQTGKELFEDDITRMYIDWADICDHMETSLKE